MDPLRVSLRDIAFIAFKRKRSILTILLSALVSAVIYLWLVRGDIYEISAKLLIKIGHEQASLPSIVGEAPMVVSQRAQAVNTELDILQSTDLLARVVDDLGLDRPSVQSPPEALLPRLRYQLRRSVSSVEEWVDDMAIRFGLRERLTPRQKAILMLQKGLSVTAQVDSNIIVARLTLPVQNGGASILNRLLSVYEEFRLGTSQRSALVGILREEMERRARALKTAEDQLRTFEFKSNIVSMDSQRQLLLQQLTEEESALSAERTRYNQTNEKVKRLTREMESPEPNFGELGGLTENTLPAALADQLATLLREHERLLLTDLLGSPRMQANLQQSRALLKLLVDNLRTDAAEQGRAYEAHKSNVETLKAQLAGLQEHGTDWSTLRRSTRVLEDEYVLYKKKFEEANVNSDLGQRNIGNIEIIEHAMDAVTSKGLSKTKLLVLVLFLSIFAAVAWVSVAEFFDDRVYSAGDLERVLGVPVQAVVPLRAIPSERRASPSVLSALLSRHRTRS